MKNILLILFLTSLSLCFASANHEEIVERMPNLVMQLGIIIFAARIGSILFEKMKIPGVLGELFIGILIGPYLLGAIPIVGFPNGIFGSANHSFPIQPELYGISIVASIILLFLSGLETDIDMFIKFSLAGSIIGISGIVFSFVTGAVTAMYFLNLSFFDPKCLFLGIMSTATSVGITARILSERKKTDTPEGVTIMAGAVIDDVLGVILLAIVMGISVLSMSGGRISWSKIGFLAFKEIGIWLGFTLLGLYFAHKIGRFLKRFKNHIVFSILAFSFALVIAGLFERAGLAMIIGAYVVGFTLSKT
jgi:Kef-type K+ transport system membrane component KefB